MCVKKGFFLFPTLPVMGCLTSIAGYSMGKCNLELGKKIQKNIDRLSLVKIKLKKNHEDWKINFNIKRSNWCNKEKYYD